MVNGSLLGLSLFLFVRRLRSAFYKRRGRQRQPLPREVPEVQERRIRRQNEKRETSGNTGSAKRPDAREEGHDILFISRWFLWKS